MYIRSAHLPADRQDIVGLIQGHMFATLVSRAANELQITHLPFLYDPSRGEHGTLLAHLARANPHASLLQEHAESVVIFNGPHGYVSPSWYPHRRTPPSWNYAVAHCHGVPHALEPAETLAAIVLLVNEMERRHAVRWRIEELAPQEVERLVARVLAFEIPVSRIEAKFQMSQGERPDNIRAATDELDKLGSTSLAVLMRKYNPLAFAD